MKGYYAFKLCTFTALWIVPFLVFFVVACATHTMMKVLKTLDTLCISVMRKVVLTEERLRDQYEQYK